MQKSTQPSQISTYTFTYDAYGRRTQKKYTYTPGSLTQVDYIKNETTSYTYDNSGRLVNERCVSVYDDNSTETHEFTYLYDESGIVGAMFSKNGATATPYYYRRNLQGDVTAIYDQNGVRKAEYAYDAWGNCTVTYSGDYNIAYTNPILYRGYYYDRSTGLYYLNARYYNPQWRRFISPDSTEYLDPESVNGLNLYAYCGNDPVNYVDPSGCLAIETLILTGLLVGLGIGAGIGYATYIDRQDDNEVNGSIGWKPYLGGAMMGGAIGFGIAYFGPQLLALISSSLPTLGTTGTTSVLALAGGGTITISVADAIIGTLAATLGIMLFAKPSRRSPKDMSSDKPSWVNRDMIDFNKTAQQNAEDILNQKYGNNWAKGAKTEYNQIVKWIIRKIFYGRLP